MIRRVMPQTNPAKGAGQSDRLDIPRPGFSLGPARVMPGLTFRSIKAEAEEEAAGERIPVMALVVGVIVGIFASFAWLTLLALILFDWSAPYAR